MKQDLYCGGSVKMSNTLGVVILEVVPSGSGLAELYVRFDQVPFLYSDSRQKHQ